MKIILVILFALGLAMQSGISIPQMMEYGLYYENYFYSFIPVALAQTDNTIVYRGDIFQDIDYKNGTHKQIIGLPRFITDGTTVDSLGKFDNYPNYIPYRIYDKQDYITYETGTVSWTFNKLSCTAKLYTSGHVNSTATPTIENISWTMQEEVNGIWTNTIHNDMGCVVSISELPNNEIKLIAKQGNSSIGYKEIEFNQKGGKPLETFYRTPDATFDGQKYGFAESHIKTQTLSIKEQKFDKNIIESVKFLKSKFMDDQGNDIPIITENTNGQIIFNTKNSIHNALTDVTVKKYNADKLQTVYDFHDAIPLLQGESLEIDPTFSSNNPAVDGKVSNDNTVSVCDSGSGVKDTSSVSLPIQTFHSADSEDCTFAFIEWDISPIPTGAVVTNSVLKFDIGFVVDPRNCDFVAVNSTRPSTASATDILAQGLLDIDFLDNDATCTTEGDNKNIDLGISADEDIESKLAGGWFGLIVKHNSVVQDGTSHTSTIVSEESTPTPAPTLEITYTAPCTPNAPTSPSAESNSTSIINLSWTAPTNCTSPALTQVYQSISGSFAGEETTIYNSTVKLTHSATSLSGNNDFFYRIRYQSSVSDGSIWGANSTIVSDYTTPYNPTSLMTTIISTTQINLSWTAPNGTGSLTYKIERESPVGGGFSTLINNTGTSTTNYNNTSLSSGTQYNYRVSAWNSDSVSSPSSASAKFTPNNAPTGLTATVVSTSQINLSWTAPSGTVTGYKIERESPIGGGWGILVADTGTTAVTYSNTGLTTNTQYNYRVSAINAGGTSAASTADDGRTFGVADPPTGLTVSTISTTQLNLSWIAPSWTGGYSITGYKIERESPIGGGFSTLINNTGVVLSYSNTSLINGTQYNYRLYTWNSQGASSATSAVANYTLNTPPTSLTATPTTGTNINLSWTAPYGTVTGYKIERESPIAGGFATIVANTGTTSTTYSNSGLSLLTQYNYRVSAINAGGTSAVSNQANATTFDYPSPPLNLQASASTPTSISLNWGLPTNNGTTAIIGYKIERESPIDGGFSTIVNNTGNTLLGYTNSPLSSSTQYNYRVSAWNSAGLSTPSNEDDATTFIGISGYSTFTKSVIGDSMKVTHKTFITNAIPSPTITSLRLYQDGTIVKTTVVSQAIAAGANYTFSPYWYQIPNTSSHNYNVIAVTSQWNGTKLLNSTSQSASQEYDPDYFTSEEGNIEVNYTKTRTASGATLNIKVNREVISPLWNVECNVKSRLFDDGTWLNESSVGYYNQSITVERTKNAYITCYNDQLLFTTTSFGQNNATTSLVDFTSQLGSFFGVPIPFLFVVFLAAIFTGRSAPTGAIFIAGTLGTMGVMGYFLDPDGTSDNMLTVTIWGGILLLTALATFLGKRYY